MPKPIFVIDDFSSGITYDETENNLTGFSDVQNIDLKSIKGGAILGEKFDQTAGGGNFLWANNPVTWNVDIHTSSEGGEANVFVPRMTQAGISGQIYAYNGQAKTWSVFKTKILGEEPPIFHEIVTFNDSLVYSAGCGFIGSCYGWTTGSNSSLQVTNGSPTVTLSTGFGQQLFSKRMAGGTIYIWSGSAYVSYTVSAYVDDTQITLSSNYLGATNSATKGYCYNFTDNGFLNLTGTVTPCALPNKTTLYRPFIELNGQLYVGDGDLVCSLNSTLTNWQTVNGSGAISVGRDYTVKQMQKIGGYIYILADKLNTSYYNSQTLGQIPKQESSRLFIWDGASVGFANIIDIGSHCFCIKAIENRIYALIKSNKGDGALFTYFNGSDFPNIGKIQVSNIFCPISNIAYDRGKFHIVASGKDKETNVVNAIYTYGTYSTETPCIYKPYQNSNGTLYGIGFVKDGSDGLDPASINGGLGQILMINQDVSSGDKTLKRSSTGFQPSGSLTTQKYEMTFNQFGQLVKGVQVNFKDTLPGGCTTEVWYRGDENTTFIKLGTLTSANQNNILYGINQRFKKLQLNIVLKTTVSGNTPKPIKIAVY